MPWSRVRQNASCTWIAIVETVSRPSYTLCSCRRHPEGFALSWSGLQLLHQHAAFRYWIAHCLPLFDSAPACSAPLPASRVNQRGAPSSCCPCPCRRSIKVLPPEMPHIDYGVLGAHLFNHKRLIISQPHMHDSRSGGRANLRRHGAFLGRAV